MNERTFGTRICVWCGKEFVAKSPKQTSCKDDHFRPCAICGQPLLVKESYQNYMKYGPRTCPKCRKKLISDTKRSVSDESKQRTNEKRKQTLISKYGVDSPLRVDSIKRKMQQTVKERYGVDNLSQSEVIQNKIRENSMKNLGVTHYSQDPDIRSRMIAGMVDKYGVQNAMQSAELRAKAAETNLRRYGSENVLSNKSIQDKIKFTCMSKYGVPYAAQSSDIINKRTQTNYERYGGPAYIFSPDYLKTTVIDASKYAVYESFKEDPEKFILSEFNSAPSYHELAQITGVSETTIGYHIVRLRLQHLVRYSVSYMEEDMYKFLSEVVGESNIVRHTRSIIAPYELDFYIPKFQLGIECNPTATHNSDIGFKYAGNVIRRNYHKDKTDAAEKVGIRIIHVFGYDWTVRSDVIKSMICSALGEIKTRYYARKLSFCEVSYQDSKDFLSKNHRQGSTMSSVRLGLHDGNGLVSLMTFGKLRNLNGGPCEEGTWELSRFCSLLNCSVVGGASKLLKHFISEYNPIKIISFSDRATTSGKLYEKLGFHSVSISDPGYVWADPNTEQYFNRVTCQKSNLKKLFNDNSIDVDNKTESEIMIQHGFGRVYDSGLIRWELML